MIEEGNVAGVVSMLGRYFSVGGAIVKGMQRGADLGFPTANVEPLEELIPKPGVYAVRFMVDGRIYDGACNIGFNPTFDGERLSVEVHVIDFSGDLYGKQATVFFIDRLRDERSFNSVSELKEAINRDIEQVRTILAVLPLSEDLRQGLGK
jgi:riboflavin kinase/FMN adenylyltransferase